MRMLAIAVIAFLLARPKVPGMAGSSHSGARAAVVIIIDNSGSMGYRFKGQTLLVRGKALASKLLGEARGPREQVLAVVRGHLQHFASVENAMKIYISATNGFQWELRTKLAVEVSERLSGFEAQVVNICQAGMDEGIFKKDVSAQDLAAVILGVPHSFLMAAARNDPPDVAAGIPAAEATVNRLLGTD